MTVLSAAQSASIRLVGRKPTTLFSTTDQMAMELADLATETAVAIAKERDWTSLTKLAAIPGDGSTIGFPLPPDYDRMLIKGDVHSTTWNRFLYTPAVDLDQWLFFQTFLTVATPGYWIILENQMQVFPAMSADETAKFYYIRNTITADATKTAFTADSDEFALDERLLTLGLIWRWRAQKRLEYAEDLKNYDIALAEIAGKDKGSRMITVGGTRGKFNTQIAYPMAIQP